MNSWSKSDWKFWLASYIEFYNAYQEYVWEWNNGMNMGGMMNSSSNSSSMSFNNSGLTLNFTDIWTAVYDLDTINIVLIIADLESSSSLVGDCRSWFSAYFGMNGFITLDITYSQYMSQHGSISSNLQDIINYIKNNIEKEIAVLCPQCNFTFPMPVYPAPVDNCNSSANLSNATNSTGSGSGITPGLNDTNGTDMGSNSTMNSTNSTMNSTNSTMNSTDNSTMGNNSTDNSTSNSTNSSMVEKYSSSNYTLPSSCSYSSDMESVTCTEGVMRTVTYSFMQINSYWMNSLNNVCTNAAAQYFSCTGNTIITDISTCFRLTFFN